MTRRTRGSAARSPYGPGRAGMVIFSSTVASSGSAWSCVAMASGSSVSACSLCGLEMPIPAAIPGTPTRHSGPEADHARHNPSASSRIRDVSAETLCAEFHKPFPRRRSRMVWREPQQLECDLARWQPGGSGRGWFPGPGLTELPYPASHAQTPSRRGTSPRPLFPRRRNSASSIATVTGCPAGTSRDDSDREVR
jgi:hypothetical protein